MKREVFDGVKVADFGWVGVGPWPLTALAVYGATVVRVESQKRPDLLRTTPPFKEGVPGIDRSGLFAFTNANKYSIALDLKDPKGLEVAKRLVAWADLVGNSFTAGAFERLGFGYEDLVKIKPDIILYRSCIQGLTGPYARHPGFGSQLVSLSGFTHFTGWPDREPVQPFGPYTDFTAVPIGIAAVAAALAFRHKTGKGQLIDLSQFEASVPFVTQFLLDCQANERELGKQGNASPCAAPHGAYRCCQKDTWCVIAVFTEDEWASFCRVTGDASWTKDPKFATLKDRKENEEELNRRVEEWTRSQPVETIVNSMQKAGVAAGRVATPADQWEEPLCHWGSYAMLEHRELGLYPHVLYDFSLSKTPANARMPSPCLGEHTEFVCKEFLKMSEEEFVELLVAGIFE